MSLWKTNVLNKGDGKIILYRDDKILEFDKNLILLRRGRNPSDIVRNRLNYFSEQYNLGFTVRLGKDCWVVYFKGAMLKFTGDITLIRNNLIFNSKEE